MKKLVLLLFTAQMLFSCSSDDNYIELNGTYTEKSPVENRTSIRFNSNSDLTIIKSENTADNFKYEFHGDYILLIDEASNLSQSFEFEKINTNEFKIQNLYPDIPENGTSYMIFKK